MHLSGFSYLSHHIEAEKDKLAEFFPSALSSVSELVLVACEIVVCHCYIMSTGSL